MAPYLVRRGVEDYGATEDEILVAISPEYTEDQAFPILGSHHATSQGDAAISGAQLNTRDLSAWPVLTGNRDELQLEREPTAAAIDRSVPWELAEWTGAPDSPHGWRIRAVSGIRLLSTETDELTGFYNDIDDVDQVVPFLIGSDYAGAGRTDGDRKVTLKVDATKRVRVQREASASALIVYFAIVEFGSAWTVENNIEHTFTAAGAVETETVAAVDWSKTLIEGRLRGPGNGLDESGAVIFRGATSTTVKQKLRSGATLPALYSTVLHLASHPGLNVEHFDSVDGGETDHASGATSVERGRGSDDAPRLEYLRRRRYCLPPSILGLYPNEFDVGHLAAEPIRPGLGMGSPGYRAPRGRRRHAGRRGPRAPRRLSVLDSRPGPVSGRP